MHAGFGRLDILVNNAAIHDLGSTRRSPSRRATGPDPERTSSGPSAHSATQTAITRWSKRKPLDSRAESDPLPGRSLVVGSSRVDGRALYYGD